MRFEGPGRGTLEARWPIIGKILGSAKQPAYRALPGPLELPQR
ncbi:hypothetical protein [Actinomadura rudentiformis]|nr:hypothetical protein [Actinomadura rudentiformis]